MNVFDASALLAFLQGEPGADVVESALGDGGSCSAANWSEMAQKVLSKKKDWTMVRSLLLSYGLGVEPVTAADAEVAASIWRERPALSLGDRLCLALGERLDATVLTADLAWGEQGRVRQIRGGGGR